jgi:hypothetical protein
LVELLAQRVVVEVAVVGAGVDAACVGVRAQRPLRVQRVRQRKVQQRRAVARVVGPRVDAGAVALQEALLLQAVAVQVGAGERGGEGQVGVAAAAAELGEQLAQAGRRVGAPAALVQALAGDEPVRAVGRAAAVLELRGAVAVRPGPQLQRGAGVLEPVLGLHGQRAAQRVQAEQRVGAGVQRQRRDGGLGDEVPADDIAEGLVQPHAVHVERQALLRAQQRRGGVAAVVHVGLESVALHLVEVDAAQAPVHEARQVQRLAALDVRGAGRLHGGGDPVARHVHARHRRQADDLDALQQHLRLGRGRHGQGQRGPAEPAVGALLHGVQRTTTPQGSLPTATSATRCSVSVSMTDTAPERPQAT